MASCGSRLALALVATLSAPLPAGASDPLVCNFEIHNASGCTAGGHYSALKAASPAECCAHCSSEAQCNAWSFHAGGTDCYLATAAKLAHNSGTADTTCGCKHAGCLSGPPAPAPPAGQCEPVQRPPKPTTIPLPAGKARPHIVTVLVDVSDVWWYRFWCSRPCFLSSFGLPLPLRAVLPACYRTLVLQMHRFAQTTRVSASALALVALHLTYRHSAKKEFCSIATTPFFGVRQPVGASSLVVIQCT